MADTAGRGTRGTGSAAGQRLASPTLASSTPTLGNLTLTARNRRRTSGSPGGSPGAGPQGGDPVEVFSAGSSAAWSWLFFAARSPRAGLVGTLLLDVSTLHLIRTTSRTDRGAATALLPYAAWCWFATALNAKITQLNHCS
ncbi:tryptophan-rich sensory protein [Streptomyces sp. PA03-1a]|nr:tryptophan-rich sensory protein [Streptomyces sp. PA03-1a]